MTDTPKPMDDILKAALPAGSDFDIDHKPGNPGSVLVTTPVDLTAEVKASLVASYTWYHGPFKVEFAVGQVQRQAVPPPEVLTVPPTPDEHAVIIQQSEADKASTVVGQNVVVDPAAPPSNQEPNT